MKILLMNHVPLIGTGSGVYTQNIAEVLTKKGHEVCVIFPENNIVKPIQNIKLHPVYFNAGNNIPGELPFNFPCFTTHPRSMQPFYDLTEEELSQYKEVIKTAIEEEIKEFKPDIIHSGHIWIYPSIAANYNIPLVITTHGTDVIGYNRSDRFKPIATDSALKADAIISVSQDNYEVITQIYPFIKDKTVIIPNGYNSDNIYYEDIDKDEFLKQFGITKHYDKIVSFVGRFIDLKGIDTLLKAAQIYEDENTLTILVGTGETLEEMKTLAKTLKLKNIAFIGHQPPNIIRKINSIADVAVVPSRSEAFPLVVIEAMACGTPVIGTRIGGIPEAITKENGIIIEPEDYNDLANKVKQILNKEIEFDRKKIAQKTKETYSQDNFGDILINLYKDIIEKHKEDYRNNQ